MYTFIYGNTINNSNWEFWLMLLLVVVGGQKWLLLSRSFLTSKWPALEADIP
jgi:hypothetical protein